MIRKFICFLFLILPLSSFAVHLRSGEISYKPVSGQANTYEITVTVYTNALVAQDLPSVLVTFGDGSTATINRTTATLVTTAIRKNTYVTTHKYNSNGSYIISISPTHRNSGILNIPSSESCSLYVESMLTISSSLTAITSPQLTLQPIGDGCTDVIYKINPGAIDSDGDVLTFDLIKCRTTATTGAANGYDIPGYEYPNQLDATGKTTFTINNKTGELVWDKPSIQGEYNVAFKISIWRKGVLIGYVVRDMQITIAACPNKPPVITTLSDTCIEAGKTLTYKVTSSDPDAGPLTFTTTGVPYTLTISPAVYTAEVTAVGKTSGTFNWNTKYEHVQKNPYQVYYKVEDTHDGLHLSDITSNFITVVAPSVKNVKSTVYTNGFIVKWDQSVCPQATGYNIWRKVDTTALKADNCTQGASSLGFTLAGTVTGATTLSYTDTNNGLGLLTGYNYCYIVTAIFSDEAESHPSEEYCAPLLIPFIKVIKDTLSSCLYAKTTIDSTIIQFESSDPSIKYVWTSSPEITLSTTSKAVPDLTFNREGFYFIKIVATSGLCIDSATIYVNVVTSPKAKISLTDYGGMPDAVTYYNHSTNNYTSTEWTLPDGSMRTANDSVSMTYSNNGEYRVLLKVYNALGCYDTISILHKVALKGLFVPNAFEPESSYAQINTFKPAGMGLLTYHIGIWDLWGNLIWESTRLDKSSPSEGWNGCDKKGKKLPSQVYIWRIKAIFLDNTLWRGIKDHFGTYHTEGSLTLVR